MRRTARQMPLDLFVCLSLSLAAAAGAQPASPLSGPPLSEMEAVQKACDGAIRGYSLDAPIDHILPTHGIYVEGYGAVFVTDVNLVSLPPLFGFGGIAPAEYKRIHDSKVKRLPEVRTLMIQMILGASKTLVHLTPDESILIQVNYYYMQREDRTGLPKSISVQGKKKDLLEAVERKTPAEAVSGILKIRVE